MKIKALVHVCDLCGSYTHDVLEEGGIEIPRLAVHFGTGGDVLKDVFICHACSRDKDCSIFGLYRYIDKTRTENQA